MAPPGAHHVPTSSSSSPLWWRKKKIIMSLHCTHEPTAAAAFGYCRDASVGAVATFSYLLIHALCFFFPLLFLFYFCYTPNVLWASCSLWYTNQAIIHIWDWECCCDAAQQCDEIIKFSLFVFRSLQLLMVFCIALCCVCVFFYSRLWNFWNSVISTGNVFKLTLNWVCMSTSIRIHPSIYLSISNCLSTYLFLVRPIKNGFGIGRAEVELI